MSKKRRTRQQKINYQQGRLVKIKELQKLRMEIIDIDNKIKEQRKFKPIKNLKIFGATCKKILLPFVLITGVAVGVGQVVNGGYPFKRDKFANIKSIEVNYETDENLIIKENYVKYTPINVIFGTNPEKSELKIYFPYKLNDSNKYEQTIRTYKLSDLDKEKLYDAILNDDIEDTITDLEKYKEEVKIIDEIKEPNDDYIVKCNLNFLDEKDKLYVEETLDKNLLTSFSEIGVILLLCFIFIEPSKLKKSITEINKQYEVISSKKLKEQLECKKQKYLELKKGYKS